MVGNLHGKYGPGDGSKVRGGGGVRRKNQISKNGREDEGELDFSQTRGWVKLREVECSIRQ